jgi:monoterpene epsilon-lactone hydrolase
MTTQTAVEMIRTAKATLSSAPNVQESRGLVSDFFGQALLVPDDVSFWQEADGMWAETPECAADRVILYLHGGGYYSGDVNTWRPLYGALTKASNIRSFAPTYRLAPEHPFPAAIDDCFGAYRRLLDSGYKAENIVLAGDSAGGTLAIAVMLRAREAGVPQPAGAYLISPWTDMEMTEPSIDLKAGVDPYADRALLELFAQWYLQGQSARNPLASPMHADLKGLPPVLIQFGSHDVFVDEIMMLARQFALADVDTTVRVWPGCFHAFPMWNGRLEEAGRAVDEAARFLRNRMRDDT